MSLTISRRLGLLVAVAVVASLIAIAMQLMMMRSAMVEERKSAIKGQVQTAMSIVGEFKAAADKGQLTEAEAQERALAVLRDIRYGNNDYLFIYLESGVLIMAGPNTGILGKNLIDAKDPTGFPFVRGFIAAGARDGGGFTYLMYPRPGHGDTPLPKLAYSLEIRPWNWVISTGVWTDDIDAAYYAQVQKVVISAALLIAALCGVAFWLSRGLVKPLLDLTAAVTELASGNLAVAVPAADRHDELGKIAKAIVVFKDNATAQRELESEQKQTEARTAAQRKRDMVDLASKFERTV